VKFTCSIGVTEVVEADAALEDVLERADAAMYQAKRNGRNGVEVSTASMLADRRQPSVSGRRGF
jgi:diguanylate cyclase (GGDEF)-like protein